MIDNCINIVYAVLMLMIILGTVKEWSKTKYHLQLLPIVAYVFSFLSFIGSYREGALHPWIAAFAWLAIGLVIRVVTLKKSKHDTTQPEDD